jgi:hypothetical protein
VKSREYPPIECGDMYFRYSPAVGDAPEGYRSFDSGAPHKFVIDPRGLLPKPA